MDVLSAISVAMGGAVEHAELITTVAEAAAYYAERLAGSHKIQSAGRDVTIVFDRGATHLYSLEATATPVVPVTRRLGGGRVEAREFSLERARLMDEVLRAVSLYTVSVPGTRCGLQEDSPRTPRSQPAGFGLDCSSVATTWSVVAVSGRASGLQVARLDCEHRPRLVGLAFPRCPAGEPRDARQRARHRLTERVHRASAHAAQNPLAIALTHHPAAPFTSARRP